MVVTVRVPATSANLGPGFDALGLALTLYDEVTATRAGGRGSVIVQGEGAGVLPSGDDHLVVRAMAETFAELAVAPVPVELACVNRIPQARGLGSSSAAIVAGILLARALVAEQDPDRAADFDDAAVLRLATRLEGHPDNVAPCLLGGLTIAWLESSGARAVRLEPAAGVRPILLVPDERGLTATARAALPHTVPHVDAAHAAGRAALLVHALTAATGLLLPATEDRLHQDYRAPGAPATAALVARLRAAGVPAVVSGAGPSVLAFGLLNGGASDPCELPIEVPTGWRRHNLRVDTTGAVVRRLPSRRTLASSSETRRRQTGVAPARRVV